MTDERDELHTLLHSAGWQRLLGIAKQWHGAAACMVQVKQAKSMIPDRLERLNKIEQIEAISEAVNALLSWPQERIQQVSKQVEAAAQPESMSRGGAR